MKIKTAKEISSEESGLIALIYSETGVGKTYSIWNSAPGPLAYFMFEPRPPHRTIKAVNRDDLDYDVFIYENWEDMIEFFANPDNITKYRTIALDSLTHLMNIRLSQEIQGQSYESLLDKDKKKGLKSLIASTKMSQEDWGALAQNMFRLCNLVMRLASEYNKIVICTALEESAPKWDRSLAGAPHFGGQAFGRNYAGFFDLIGRVSSREKDGEIVYPPMVSFSSPKGDFVAKATGGMAKTKGPLDWTKILNNGG